MREVWALAMKDLRVISHDKAGMFFLFFFPIGIAVFFSLIFSGVGAEAPRDMKIAVVDADNTEGSRAFVKSLGDEEGITLEPKTAEDARTAVRRGWVAAYILLPEGFGAAQEDMFSGASVPIQMGMDPSRQAETAMLKGLLMKHSFAGMQEQFRDRKKLREHLQEGVEALKAERNEESAKWLPFLTLMEQAFDSMPDWEQAAGGDEGRGFDFSGNLQVDVQSISQEQEEGTAPTKSYQTSFPQGMIWGFLGSAAAFGISLVVERTHGTLTRLRIAPIGRAHILAGKGLACFMAMASVMTVLVAIGVLGFGMRPNSFLKLAAAILCSCVCFVGMMMFISVLGKTEQSAGGFGWAIMVTLAMIGGGSLPLFLMPPFLQKLSNISPVKWATLSLEGSIWRNFSWSEMLLPCAILLTAGVVFFCIGARAFRWIQE